MADSIALREPSLKDEEIFLSTMNKSQESHFRLLLHQRPLKNSPTTLKNK